MVARGRPRGERRTRPAFDPHDSALNDSAIPPGPGLLLARSGLWRRQNHLVAEVWNAVRRGGAAKPFFLGVVAGKACTTIRESLRELSGTRSADFSRHVGTVSQGFQPAGTGRSGAPSGSCGRPIGNRRYSRFEICATLVAAPPRQAHLWLNRCFKVHAGTRREKGKAASVSAGQRFRNGLSVGSHQVDRRFVRDRAIRQKFVPHEIVSPDLREQFHRA